MLKQLRPLTRTNPVLQSMPVWAEAEYQCLAKLSFRAFYHLPESPLLAIGFLLGNRIVPTLLAPVQKSFQSRDPH